MKKQLKASLKTKLDALLKAIPPEDRAAPAAQAKDIYRIAKQLAQREVIVKSDSAKQRETIAALRQEVERLKDANGKLRFEASHVPDRLREERRRCGIFLLLAMLDTHFPPTLDEARILMDCFSSMAKGDRAEVEDYIAGYEEQIALQAKASAARGTVVKRNTIGWIATQHPRRLTDEIIAKCNEAKRKTKRTKS